jgi:hypothetical protein
MGGVMLKTRYMGLDWNVIISIAEKRGVIDDNFFDKLCFFESSVLDILNGTAEDGPCTKEDRARCIFELGGEEFLEFQCNHCERSK